MNKKINIFTGHFGSGKTEIALNYALKLKEANEKVAIVDLDIVNPFYRTKDAEEMLKQKNINVLASQYANSNIDVPALPAEILSLLQSSSQKVVLDIGGDDDGAIVLGRYNKYLKEEDYDMFFVINTKRPQTSNVEDILDMIVNIEKASRLKVNGLINNTNLSTLTKKEDIEEGIIIIEQVSNILGIPIKYITGTQEVLSGLPKKYESFLMPINIFLKLPWES